MVQRMKLKPQRKETTTTLVAGLRFPESPAVESGTDVDWTTTTAARTLAVPKTSWKLKDVVARADLDDAVVHYVRVWWSPSLLALAILVCGEEPEKASEADQQSTEFWMPWETKKRTTAGGAVPHVVEACLVQEDPHDDHPLPPRAPAFSSCRSSSSSLRETISLNEDPDVVPHEEKHERDGENVYLHGDEEDVECETPKDDELERTMTTTEDVCQGKRPSERWWWWSSSSWWWNARESPWGRYVVTPAMHRWLEKLLFLSVDDASPSERLALRKKKKKERKMDGKVVPLAFPFVSSLWLCFSPLQDDVVGVLLFFFHPHHHDDHDEDDECVSQIAKLPVLRRPVGFVWESGKGVYAGASSPLAVVLFLLPCLRHPLLQKVLLHVVVGL